MEKIIKKSKWLWIGLESIFIRKCHCKIIKIEGKRVKENDIKNESTQEDYIKKKTKSYGMLISVVLNIVLLIVCLDTIHIQLNAVSDEDRLWETSVANVLYCAQSFEKTQSEEAYYYIVGETATLVDLLPYTGFGDNEQKQKYELLYKQLAVNAEIMKTKGSELAEIFTLLSKRDAALFDKIDVLCSGISGNADNGEEKTEQE